MRVTFRMAAAPSLKMTRSVQTAFPPCIETREAIPEAMPAQRRSRSTAGVVVTAPSRSLAPGETTSLAERAGCVDCHRGEAQ